MTPITAQPPTAAVPDAIAATPGQASVQQPATGPRPGGRDGPLRGGNPRGNPHLAPLPGQAPHRVKCPTGSSPVAGSSVAGSSVGRLSGAKARTTGRACRASLPAVGLAPGRLSRGLTRGAMANGRCRSHGGKSTGPRTPEGRARVARAHTTHGKYAQVGLGAKHRLHIQYLHGHGARASAGTSINPPSALVAAGVGGAGTGV